MPHVLKNIQEANFIFPEVNKTVKELDWYKGGENRNKSIKEIEHV